MKHFHTDGKLPVADVNTYQHMPSFSGWTRNRRSSRKCNLLARGRSGHSHTHLEFRIPQLGGPRSCRSALKGNNFQKKFEALIVQYWPDKTQINF